MIIHFLYATAATIAICACFPQLRKLVETKQSDEFSLPTWTIWLVTQGVAIVYAASIGDLLYTAVSVVWFAFYALMVGLIVRYRRVARLAVAKEPAIKP